MASDAMKPAATFDPTRPRRLHPLTLVFETIRIGRHLVLPALAGVASTANDGFARTLTVGLGILAVPALIAAIARFVGFRYHLTGEELILDSGVFSRRRRIIPLARIQNVDVSEKPLERLCGVASLLIETAGGKKTEGVLSVLSRADADALRAILLERRAGAASTDDAPPVETLVRLSTRELVVAGATANEIGLVAAALAGALQFVEDTIYRALPDAIDPSALDGSTPLLVVAAFIVGGAIVILLAGWLLSITGSVLGYHGFVLERVGGELRKRYGLLARREGSVPLRRVQAIRIEESLLRRPFDLAAVRIETAGSAGSGKRRHSEAFVPLVRREDAAGLVARILDGFDPDTATLLPVHPRARRRIFLRLAWPVVVLAGALALLHRPAWLALLLLLAPFWALAWNGYRNRRYAAVDGPDIGHENGDIVRDSPAQGGYIIVRDGLIGRTTWIIPRRKIQTVHVASTPFQRRHGIATLIVDTASGPRGAAHIRDLPLDVAHDLAGRLSVSAREITAG